MVSAHNNIKASFDVDLIQNMHKRVRKQKLFVKRFRTNAYIARIDI